MIWRCDLKVQYDKYRTEILTAIESVLESGRYILAESVSEFEHEFAAYLGVENCRSLGSGTDALIIALRVTGIEPGDEVITTPFTAIPTVSAIIAAGGKPVFVDVEESTFLMEPDAVLNAINERTRAILPVHIFGNVFDVEQIKDKLPEKVWLIEDAAQAHGSSIHGKMAGSIGDMGAFSFYPTKNLGGYGDSGALVFSEESYGPFIERLRQYGMVDKDHIIHHGINSRMDELQAAVLKVKLRYLEKMNERRREIAQIYKNELSSLIDFQTLSPGVVGNYHVMVGRVKGNRDRLLERMTAREVQCNIYYPLPLHLQEANKDLGYKTGEFPIAERLCKEVIALPMYPELCEKDLFQIINTVKEEMSSAYATAK